MSIADLECRTLEWSGCYDANWRGFITDESFSHPAKMSRGLLERIIDYGLSQGFWKRGDMLLDPFGGVCTTGLVAAWHGLRSVSVELEPRFVGFANENIELHRAALKAAGLPVPVFLQGDSRQLCDVVGAADGLVSSPPFQESGCDDSRPFGGLAEKRLHGGECCKIYGDTPGQLGSLPAGSVDSVITSPPFLETEGGKCDPVAGWNTAGGISHENDSANGYKTGLSGALSSPPYSGNEKSDYLMSDDGKTRARDERRGYRQGEGCYRGSEGAYGQTEGQLGAMASGSIDGAISSPPFTAGPVHGGGHGIDWDKIADPHAGRMDSPARKGIGEGYGSAEGQLGSLPAGSVDGAVSSPPYEGSIDCSPNEKTRLADVKGQSVRYSTNGTDNLGNSTGQTFWQAAREIVAQSYTLCRPGAVTAWVCKDFVKGGKRVPFCDDWARLLEACGFSVFLRVHAMLVKVTAEGEDLFGVAYKKTKERKSFFRRLAEKKGSPPIDWEEVIWAEKTCTP